MSITPANLENIFATAVGLPPDAVEAYLVKACADDKKTYEDVYSLVLAHQRNEQDGYWLDSPPINAVDLSGSGADVAESVGDVIGRYTLLHKIGEGGMGVVYRAKQNEGVRRDVALKIVKLGMDTRQVVARFEAERQTLSLFNHVNIAGVIDAGMTDSGRPYFVMELVDGMELSKYIAQEQPCLEERLTLFVDICLAVHHAHQKGIIHRDLKPSNVLVKLVDAQPVVKVIDFGIAKAIGHDLLPDRSLVTSCSALIGTPTYMSPEQADPACQDIDSRSDVYSLGILVYEMLTGTTPFSSKNRTIASSSALDSDWVVDPPSTLLSRKTETQREPDERKAQVNIIFRSELDWIILKALSPSRDDRYASASEFASDIQRFMAEEPVLAAPPARLYKLTKFARRNRMAVTWTAICLGCLIALSAVCVYLAVQTMRSNKLLGDANEQLDSKNKQLEATKYSLEQTLDNQIYQQCFAIATEKFLNEYDERIFAIEDTLFDEWSATQRRERRRPAKPEHDDDFYCFYFDPVMLLDIPSDELLKPCLQRIRDWLVREDVILEKIYGVDAFGKMEKQHVHSQKCSKYRLRMSTALRELRPAFYSQLVQEYRKSFGTDHPNVSEALNMHAASLYDTGDSVQAKRCLQESCSLFDDYNSNVAIQLKKAWGI